MEKREGIVADGLVKAKKGRNGIGGGFNLRPPRWLTAEQLKKWNQWHHEIQRWWDGVQAEEMRRGSRRKAGF